MTTTAIPSRTSHASSIATRRIAFVAAAIAASLLAWAVGDPSTALVADPALASLLRGMAVIKAMLAIAVVAAIVRRLGRPIAGTVAGAYAAAATTMGAAAASIWQLSWIPVAAVAFHVALVVALATACFDDGVVLPRVLRRR